MVNSINPAASTSLSQPVSRPSDAQALNRTQDEAPSELSVAAQIKQQANAAILQASQQVSLRSGNESLALLYSAAIDAINEKLAPSLGDNALQRGIDEGLDVSPQATADRIVNLTTAMFGRYQDSNTELSYADQVERFVELIAEGIEQGFSEARDVLDGLNVLEGDIARDIDQTYNLVQQGLQAFSDRLLGGSDSADV